MKEAIVIVGNEYIALGIIRSLAKENYRTKLIALSKRTYREAGKSKYVTAKVCCREKADEILDALNTFRAKDEKIPVITAQDRACKTLDIHLDELMPYFFIPNIENTSGKVVHLMDKKVQKDMAAGFGLHVAEGSSFITDREAEKAIIEQVKYPCFMKPVASASIKKCKRIFRKCDNPDELLAALDIARKHPCKEVLIEDYLEIEQEICAYGVAGEGQVCMPACVVTERSGKLGHEGVAAEGKIVSSDILGAEKEKLIQFVKASGLTGLFCIDLIVSHGTIYFSEMNLRAGGSGYAVTLAGVNLPGMLANMYCQDQRIEETEIRREVSFINERVETDLFIDQFISLRELRKALASDREHFIRDNSDPAPWRWFQMYSFLSWMRRRWTQFNQGRKNAKR